MMKRTIEKNFIKYSILKEIRKRKIKRNIFFIFFEIEQRFKKSLNMYYIDLSKMQKEKKRIKKYIDEYLTNIEKLTK